MLVIYHNIRRSAGIDFYPYLLFSADKWMDRDGFAVLFSAFSDVPSIPGIDTLLQTNFGKRREQKNRYWQHGLLHAVSLFHSLLFLSFSSTFC